VYEGFGSALPISHPTTVLTSPPKISTSSSARTPVQTAPCAGGHPTVRSYLGPRRRGLGYA